MATAPSPRSEEDWRSSPCFPHNCSGGGLKRAIHGASAIGSWYLARRGDYGARQTPTRPIFAWLACACGTDPTRRSAEVGQAELRLPGCPPRHRQIGDAVGHHVGARGHQGLLAVGAAQHPDDEAAARVEALLDVPARVADLADAADVLNLQALHELVHHVGIRPALGHLVGGDVAIDNLVEAQAINEALLDVRWVAGVEGDLDAGLLQLHKVAEQPD